MNKRMAVWVWMAAACLAVGQARAEFAWGESGWVSAGRVDARSDFGGRLVHGTERMGDPEGGVATAWNTTKLADGWQEVTKGTNSVAVAVLNGSGAAIEYGRLSGEATWGSGKVHVVRDWVAVPNGVTLEIGAGTVVKFTRGTGIAVERGGTLKLNGTADAPVRLTAVEDDTVGGDTDMRAAEAVGGWYIDIRGTVEDSGWTEIDHTDRSRSGGMANYGLRVGVGKVSWGETGWTAAGRVDTREDFGGRLVHGTERMGDPDGGATTAWNTTKLADGWQTVTKGTNSVEVAVLNGSGAVIEYGRLSGDATWGSGKVHVVRDWVAVPSGVTLEIGAGTVVKFTRGTGIAVERGGTLKLNGTADAPVRLTAVEDDTVGGDTDMRAAEPVGGWYIDIKGTVEDSGWTEIDHTDRSRSGGMANYGLCVGVGKVSWGETGWTAAGRVDAREDFGGRLVHGTERMGDPDGGAASAWNTTKLADGWQEVTKGTNSVEVAVLNGSGAAIEYGRLSGDTTWGSGKVHVVRDWVAVPSGVTLEIGAGAVVKFTRGTGIAVERGGTLRLNGTADAPVRLTAAEDDTEGGDTDMREEKPVGCYYIDIRGPVEDSGWTEIGYADSSRSGGMAIYGLRVGAGKLDVGRAANSDGIRVDGRAVRSGARLTMGDEWATWDTAWDGAAEVRVTLARPDGREELLGRATNGGKGSADWTGNEPGAYRVSYSAKDGSGALLATQTVQLVKLGDGTVLHAGSTRSNEVWSADSVHVVDGKVSVGNGAVLTIEAGAVVKFTDGSSLVVSSAGSCTANGVVFTHIADDTAGGDTMGDGAASWPVLDSYSVTGNLTTDAATEMRWMKVTTSGTVSSDTVWMGGRIVHVTGNLTVANGATLTIQPGAIVKFDAGVSLTVNSGGTLNAIGTRAQPIVFTSIKDDEFGGDTNGDGDSTVAQPGDWARIYAGGTVNMDYCRIRHCNNNSDYGAIHGTGGTVRFDDGVIEYSVYECVRMNSGRFESRNSVFRESSMGFGYYGGSGVYVYNGVVADCTIACRASNKHFYNTVFYRCQTFLESTSSSCDHCLFFNPAGYGVQSASQAGSNGNIWGDPLFLDADGGDFRVAEESPCVDAGNTAAAPETDYYGQPRASAFGEAMADIGIYEVQPRGVAGDVDLVTVSVSAVAEAMPGGELRVSWKVGNRGGKTASGARRDEVSLVSASGRVVSLGEKVFTQNIAAGGTEKCEAVFRVPAMAEGTWWPKVVVNSQQDIFEGSLIANNARTGDVGVEVSVPETAASAGASGTVAAGVPTVLKLHFEEEDDNRMVVLNVPAGVSVAWGFGFVPTTGGASGISGVGGTTGTFGTTGTGETAEANGSPVQFVVPEDAEAVYVVLESGTDAAYTLATESAKVAVTGVEPGEVPSSGNATLAISGAGFTAGSAVRLVGNGATIEVDSVRVVDTRTISATVDCGKLSAGTSYDVEIEAAGGIVTAEKAVRVEEAPGEGKFWARLVVPDSVREGRKAVCSIEYGNSGNADMAAPVLQVAMNGTGTLGYVDGLQGLKALQFVAAGDVGSAGVLRPGEDRRIRFELVAGKSNKMTLHTSVGSDYAPEPWGSAKEYFADLSSATTRTGLRGRDATDYEKVGELAKAKKNGEATSCVYGRVVDKNDAIVSDADVAVLDVATNLICLVHADASGWYCTTALARGMYWLEVWGLNAIGDPICVELDGQSDCAAPNIAVDAFPCVRVVFSNVPADSKIVAGLSSFDGIETMSPRWENSRTAVFCGAREGAWMLYATAGDCAAYVPIHVVECETVLVDIPFSRSGRIAGTVSNFLSMGTAGVIVLGENGLFRFLEIETDGSFEAVGLPEGEYMVSALGVGAGVCEPVTNVMVLGGGTTSIALQKAEAVSTRKATVSATWAERGIFDWTMPWNLRSELAKDIEELERWLDGTRGWITYPNPACTHNLAKYKKDDHAYQAMWNGWNNMVELYESTDRSYFEGLWENLGLSALNFGEALARAKMLEMGALVGLTDNLTELVSEFGTAAIEGKVPATLQGKTVLEVMKDYAENVMIPNRLPSPDLLWSFPEQARRVVSNSSVWLDLLKVWSGDADKKMDRIIQWEEDVLSLYEDAKKCKSLIEWLVLTSNPEIAGVALSEKWKSLGEPVGKIEAWLGIAEPVLKYHVHLLKALRTSDQGMAALGAAHAKIRKALSWYDRNMPVFKSMSELFGAYHNPCPDMEREPNTPPVQTVDPTVPQSCDPNEMSGPLGAGAARYVAPGEWMMYTVYFENKSDATAAAQEVYVTEQLSGALDWSTFEVVDVGFNNQIDLGLGGKRKGASEAAMTGTAYKVRTSLDFDEKTGTANWYMRIVDESTETRWPRDVFAGFLPPNDETGRGEGHITYRVKVREDAAAGTVIRASASIVFDYNAAIETDPAWWNTVAKMGSATVDLGNGVATNVTVMVGAPWGGQLPDPGKRQGLRFAGWFTGPNGTGEEVTSESLVVAGAKLYAFWDASAAPELWLDVSWGAVEIGTNGVVKGYSPDGNSVEGSANRYVLTGTSRGYGVKYAGGSFTNTWTNLVIDLNTKDAVAVALEGANVEVELAGDNSVASGEDCAGIRVDAKSALVLQGTGRLVARGGKCGAGIGGGKLQESGRMEIRAGTVEACGGEYGAGIGGGLVAPAAKAVVITGGSVKARGSDGGEDIGGGFGREGTGVPVNGTGAPVHEVEVPLATDTLPTEVVVDLGGGRTYRYAGAGHEDDSSLWFWLPDGTYEFEADGDDYGAYVAGEGTEAVFTDPGNENFKSPLMGGVANEGGAMRAEVNPAYRTSPFEVWTATGLKGNAWDWTLVPPGGYDWDATNAVIRIPDGTNRIRVVRLRFLAR